MNTFHNKYTAGFRLMLIACLFMLCSCEKNFYATAHESLDKKLTIYVDSRNGNDNNSGTSADKPWKTLNKVNNFLFAPGDSVLFKSGEAWQGQLSPRGSGSEGLPIVFSRYGEGNRPLIEGRGVVDQVIRISDLEQIEFSGFEITNKAANVGSRLGVLINDSGHSRKHIYLRDMYIHDISGDYSFAMTGKNTGGIGIIGTASTKFDDILIEGCEVANVTRVGIFTNLTDGTLAVRGNRPITNLVVRNNKIHHCSGDGMIIRYAYRPLIEYNEAYENHNASEDLVGYGVALWCRSTDEATFQYNEVHHTRGGKDGQAFDADEDAYRTVIQYNYSHDNEGGFMLVTSTSEDAIIRFNLSVNDGTKGKHVFDFPVWAGHVRGTGIIHNNTVVLSEGVDAVIADEALTTARFYNNIFYNTGSAALYVKSNGETAMFNNNSYYGYNSSLITDTKALTGDPGLSTPSTYGAGRQSTAGFALLSDSRARQKAIRIKPLESSYWMEDEGKTDFAGNAIPDGPVHLGAFQK